MGLNTLYKAQHSNPLTLHFSIWEEPSQDLLCRRQETNKKKKTFFQDTDKEEQINNNRQDSHTSDLNQTLQDRVGFSMWPSMEVGPLLRLLHVQSFS